MRYFLALISILFLVSCGTYRVQVRQPQISNVLAITTEGDTVQVPVQALQRNLTPDYYAGYRFYWNNSWWMYNDWYWNYWYANPRWFAPRYYVQTPRPRVSTPRYIPRVQGKRSIPQVQPNRDRTNQPQTRQPQYNRRTPPPVPSNRNSSTRSNNNSRTTNGGKPIKQYL